MTATDDFRDPLGRARRNWARVQQGDLKWLGDLVVDLHGHQVPLQDIPVTEAQLASAMQAYGRQARNEVSRGVLTGALRQIYFMVGDGVSWELFGIPQEQVLLWIREFAERAYSVMLTEPRPANAVVLLDLPYHHNWDNILGRGAARRIADAAVQWAHACYRELLDPAANATEALKAAVDLRDRVGIWQTIEDSALHGADEPWPTNLIYSRLGFTTDDCEARIDFWVPLAHPE